MTPPLLTAYFWSDVGHKDRVDAAQLDVDLETEVGEGLGRGLVHVLCLRYYVETIVI